jgi:hypothetical protein
LRGRVEAPDEETAIKKAIDEFQIGAACRIGFSRSGGDIVPLAMPWYRSRLV